MGDRSQPLNLVALKLPSEATPQPSDSIRFAFKCDDEFFHCMISYRVRAEGPQQSGGNHLARLIWDACSEEFSSTSKDAARLRHFCESLEKCGKWPREFGSPYASQFRIFLDQVNLRPGVPWKGTGKVEDGGFLGAVSRALLIIPLLSAAPARFKLEVLEKESSRFKPLLPLNVDMHTTAELFSASTDELTGSEIVRKYRYTDVRDDGSFCIDPLVYGHPDVRSNFWLAANFLPSDGIGPRGSLADMLTILQPQEQIRFIIVCSDPHIVLEVLDTSDHIFFVDEPILLQTLLPKIDTVKVVAVVIQGSKAGRLKSRIKIDAQQEQYLQLMKHDGSPIDGCTVECDRRDNVLMEFMLTRALRSLSADGFLHPCKLIMPVFVDDMDLLYRLAQRLSCQVSEKTSVCVREALEGILKRQLNTAEVAKWIKISVKDAVMFFFEFQGVQLCDATNCLLDAKEKALLVRNHVISTVGIEVQNNSMLKCVSSNPLALELLSFLDTQGLAHLRSILMKHGLTTVKEFSLLSEAFVNSIACESHALSSEPLLKETVHILKAVQNAKTSKFSLPISERLKTFEDTGASVLTILYSTYAIYLALSKPLFARWLTFIIGTVVFAVSVFQIFQGVVQLPYYIINLARSVWLFSAFFAVNLFKSISAGHRAHSFGVMLTAVACISAVVVDKLRDSKLDWVYSADCSNLFSDLDMNGYKKCVIYRNVYFSYLALMHFVVAFFILSKQELVFRGVMVGVSIQLFMTTAFDYSLTNTLTFINVGGCVLWPLLLILAEIMKHYGSLKALRIVKYDKCFNDMKWRAISTESEAQRILEAISDQLNTFGHASSIIDHSSTLGKWKNIPATRLRYIYQPTSNFDELYDIAVAVNDKFQSWIESYFQSEQSRRNHSFVWFDASTSYHHSKTFSGSVIRGPVKTPERAIAKVTMRLNCQ
jgi:hypothetical protein